MKINNRTAHDERKVMNREFQRRVGGEKGAAISHLKIDISLSSCGVAQRLPQGWMYMRGYRIGYKSFKEEGTHQNTKKTDDVWVNYTFLIWYKCFGCASDAGGTYFNNWMSPSVG